jgi:hypothetical protein
MALRIRLIEGGGATRPEYLTEKNMRPAHISTVIKERRTTCSGLLPVFGGILVLLTLATTPASSQTGTKPYKITIKDEQDKVVEPILPVDPALGINLTTFGSMSWGLKTMDGKRLTFSDGSAFTSFKIEGNVVNPGAQPQPLPPKKGSKTPRHGSMFSFQFKDIHVTGIHEVVPSKLPGPPKAGQKRKMDTVLFKYVIENKGNQETKVAMRMRMDAYNWTTDGPALWAPTTLPGKILDGVAVEGKQIPDYMISIQNRDLKNPGHLAYFTFNQGGRWEPPSKVVVTSHGAFDMGWEVNIQANQFDTDFVLFWAEKPLKPKEKRVIMYGYGTGLATNPDNEGRITTTFGGSMEPNKSFTLTAFVDDPVESQNLTLILPSGMKLLDGKVTQPVPPPDNENRSVVVWKCRVLQAGSHSLQIRSSNGVTLTKTVNIEKAK